MLLACMHGHTPHSPFSAKIFSRSAMLSVGRISGTTTGASVAACTRCRHRFCAWKRCDRLCCSCCGWPFLGSFCRPHGMVRHSNGCCCYRPAARSVPRVARLSYLGQEGNKRRTSCCCTARGLPTHRLFCRAKTTEPPACTVGQH